MEAEDFTDGYNPIVPLAVIYTGRTGEMPAISAPNEPRGKLVGSGMKTQNGGAQKWLRI